MLLITQTVFSNRLHHAKLCRIEQNKLHCQFIKQGEADTISFPDSACMVNPCGQSCAVKAWKDYVIAPDNELIQTDIFWTSVVPTKQANTLTRIYDCKKGGIACTCGSPNEEACNGTKSYCAKMECNHTTPCFCTDYPGIEKLTTIHNNELKEVEKILSLQECLLKNTTGYMGRKPLASLTKADTPEEATDDLIFSENNITVKFIAPVFHLSSAGTLILRSAGYEQIYVVSSRKPTVEVPQLFMEATNKLHFIFVNTKGKMASGSFLVKGTIYCRKVLELWSMDALYSLRCLPSSVQYVVVSGTIIMTGLMLIYVKSILSITYALIKSIVFVTRQTIRFFRGTARITLVGGHVAGNSLNRASQKVKEFLEKLELPQRANIHHALALLALCCTVTTAQEIPTSCSSNEVIKSELSTCHMEGNEKTCHIETTVQVYINNLMHTTCLFLEDPKEGHMLSVSLTLTDVKCDYATTRNYYTFPVKLRTIVDIFCSQNSQCGWSTHCTRGKSTPATSTPEALEFTGETYCKPAAFSKGCALLHNNCFFYRTILKPDYTHTYEVRRITAQTCSYQVKIKEEAANTTESLSIKNIGITHGGLRIHVFGSLQQTNIAFADLCLISRLGDAQQSYLAPCAPPSIPRKTEIGFVQANSSIAKQFLYDPAAISCEAFEDSMECELQHSLLDTLPNRNDLKLPKALALHAFSINQDGELTSKALSTAPVLIGIKFKDYKVSLKAARVCPDFETTQYQFSGCYRCHYFAKLIIKAYSQCEAGQASVQCNSLQVATPTVYLENTPTEITILFKSEARCINDDLCLLSQHSTKCLRLRFCLQSPDIYLQPQNSTIDRTKASPSLQAAWSTLWNWPHLISIGGLTRTLLYVAGGVLIAIFSISAITSCMRR